MEFSLRRISKGSSSQVRGKLAILIPTFRFDTRARHTIAGAASLASNDIAVVIADNSENPDKWSFLKKVRKLHPNIHVHCHKRNVGAHRNWTFLIDRSNLPYYLVLGDDDLCTPSFVETGLRLLEEHDDAGAARGTFLMITSDNEMTSGNGMRTEDDAYQRCINFRIGGGNTLPNSIGRRDAIQPFLLYSRDHPLKASFFDWMMAYTLLGQGKYYTEERGCYLYDVSNWENAAACWRNDAKFYVAAGLPESFTAFHGLYWAVELAHFFRGAYSPIADRDQSMQCAQSLYSNRIEHFRAASSYHGRAQSLEALTSHHPGAVECVRKLVANDSATHPQLFVWFSEILAAFEPVCAAAYADYTRASLDRSSG